MKEWKAVLRSLAFLIAAPGVVAGLVPWLLTGWQFTPLPEWWAAMRVLGVAMTATGLVVLIRAFARFAIEGRGTPAPFAPTEKLIVSGEYRYVRNPMYVAVLVLILGQALLFGSASLAVYAFLVWLAVATFVRSYEEPTLTRRYGQQYLDYKAAVPAWVPRLRPWRGHGLPG
jgi:protein-S-isoprenylcysteine O-methyltransferase Ste14